MSLKKYVYREPPTPKGLKAIEEGTLDYFDIEVYSNLNTGILEKYFEEKNRKDGFKGNPYLLKNIFIGLVIGTLFAVITEYVGLKVGIAISGGWYIVYIIGLAARWPARNVNVAAGVSTGATYIATGFIFTFPALYLLSEISKHDQYMLSDGTYLISTSQINLILPAVLIATIVGGIIGTLYFIIFRRIWLVEDPLHVPGIEANVKLLDMSYFLSKGAVEEAKKALKYVATAIGITGFFTALRDFPVGKMDSSFAYYSAYASPENLYPEASTMDIALKSSTCYDKGNILIPYSYDTALKTHIDFGLIPIQLGVGWFMKFKVAFLVSLGTLLQWFVIIPLAVMINTPIYSPGGYIQVSTCLAPDAGWTPAIAAFARLGRLIAIGAILGGGITGLLKMLPAFKSALEDVTRTTTETRRDFVKGKGWYEWPVTHIKIMTIVTFIVVLLSFWLIGRCGFLQSFIFALILVTTVFFLGAIAVKVMGETGSEPVSGTSFIVLMLLIVLFTAIRTPASTTAVLAIVGTTVFAGAISISGDIIWDFKSGLYCGNRPYHLTKGELTGLIPGAFAGLIGAVILSTGLATKQLNLAAPQAHAFATTVQIMLGGETAAQTYQLFALGIGIGVFAELLTGMGTAFGLGMYFPLSLTLPMLLGGSLRDIWEKKWLEPKAKALKWDEKTRTLKVIDTYMIATGLIVGEAILGTVIAIWMLLVI